YFLKAIAASQGYSGCPRQFCHAAAFALALLYRKRGDTARARQYYEMTLAAADREYADTAHLFE
ncbi:MAG: hypothetical protein LBS85_00595, partial [Clostridiales Family XIII bacterium]|nr:hypothetical protein [Clostridiales Family XIII bacterium]